MRKRIFTLIALGVLSSGGSTAACWEEGARSTGASYQRSFQVAEQSAQRFCRGKGGWSQGTVDSTYVTRRPTPGELLDPRVTFYEVTVWVRCCRD